MMTKLILLIFALTTFSCAGMVTKTSLEPNPTLEAAKLKKTSKPITVEYRVYRQHNVINSQNSWISLYNDEELTKLVTARLEKEKTEGITYREYKNDFSQSSFKDPEAQKQIQKIVTPTFPIQGDYLMQLEFYSEQQGHHTGFEYVAILHMLSLGLIPMTSSINDNVKTTLYSKEGKILLQKETKNQSRVWFWTPLFFFNGFHLFQQHTEVKKPVHEVSIDHAIYDLNK